MNNTFFVFSSRTEYNRIIEKGPVMLKKDQLEYYLSECMKSEADFAEIYEELEHSETIKALSGKTEDVNQVITAGLGIRLYKDLQSVYAYTNDGSEAAVTALIKDLTEALGPCEKEVHLSLEEVTYTNNNPVEIDFMSVPLEEKADLLKRANDAAFSADTRIVKVQSELLNVKQTVQIANTEGTLIRDVLVRTRMMVTAFAAEDGSLQTLLDGEGIT